jgi:formate hydrogenlyase subunit 6/NADH:ubiquinone oxidoreductase subunit I
MSFFPMAGTAIKNLFSKPATRLYPFVKREPFAGTRGNISINFSECIFCGMCMRRCPTHAITVSKDKREWQMDHLSCVICGNCALVCPKKCLKLEPHATETAQARQKTDRVETHVAPPAPPVAPKPEAAQPNA